MFSFIRSFNHALLEHCTGLLKEFDRSSSVQFHDFETQHRLRKFRHAESNNDTKHCMMVE